MIIPAATEVIIAGWVTIIAIIPAARIPVIIATATVVIPTGPFGGRGIQAGLLVPTLAFELTAEFRNFSIFLVDDAFFLGADMLGLTVTMDKFPVGSDFMENVCHAAAVLVRIVEEVFSLLVVLEATTTTKNVLQILNKLRVQIMLHLLENTAQSIRLLDAKIDFKGFLGMNGGMR